MLVGEERMHWRKGEEENQKTHLDDAGDAHPENR
jgi:hypothetical protein